MESMLPEQGGVKPRSAASPFQELESPGRFCGFGWPRLALSLDMTAARVETESAGCKSVSSPSKDFFFNFKSMYWASSELSSSCDLVAMNFLAAELIFTGSPSR